MPKIDYWEFERWCREVLPELGTFQAACHFQTRLMAGARLQKEGPTIGRSLKRLNEGLLQEFLGGGSLFDKEEQRGVQPTDAGRAVLEYGEQVYALRAALLEKLTALQSGSGVRVAMTHYAWLTYNTALETAYRKVRSDGTIHNSDKFYEQDRVWEEVEQEVLGGRADIGVYSFPPSRLKQFAPELSLIDWMEEEFVLVLPRELARKIKSPWKTIYDLSQLLPILPRVVHYRRSLGFDRTLIIHDYLRQQGVMPRFNGEWLLGVNTIAEIKETLLSKEGMSFLPWQSVEQECNKGALFAYKLYPPMRPRTIKIISRLHNARPAVKDFLDAAKSLSKVMEFPQPQVNVIAKGSTQQTRAIK